MLILSAVVCLLANPLTVECHRESVLVHVSLPECRLLEVPFEALIAEGVGGLAVIYIKARCLTGKVG